MRIYRIQLSLVITQIEATSVSERTNFTMDDNKRQRPISALFSSTKKTRSRSPRSEPEALTASGYGIDNENSSSSPETSIDSANLSANMSEAPNDISQSATDKPSQPILSSFPKQTIEHLNPLGIRNILGWSTQYYVTHVIASCVATIYRTIASLGNSWKIQ